MKLSLSRLFKQDAEQESDFQVGLRTLNLIELVKIVGQQKPHHLGLQYPRGNVHALSKILHVEFNSAFNRTADIWTMYFWFMFEGKWWQIILPFNKYNFHDSILCDSWFVPEYFVLKIVKHIVYKH